MRRLRIAGVAWTALALANCSGGLSLSDPPAPSVTMAGRWLLSAPNAPPCGMTFGEAAPGAKDGTIAPEGGCPGKFFMSRHWAYEQDALVIKDHNFETLASLHYANGRFDGQAATGMQVTLSH